MTPITQPDDTAGYAPAARPLRILFASDGSEAADGARRFLAALPLPTGSAVHILTVVRGMEWELSDWLRAVESELGRRIVEGAATSLQQEGVAVTTAVEIGAPAQEILTAAEELDADLIVLGSRGLGDVEGFLLGSVARNVVKHAGRPVLLARAPTNGLRRVLVAVDSSEHAARAAESRCRPERSWRSSTWSAPIIRSPAWFRTTPPASSGRSRPCAAVTGRPASSSWPPPERGWWRPVGQ
jgi:nucleotide-binding universal stress UspA family protein